MSKSIYEIKVKDIHGEEKTLASYQNKYLLIVNVASRCGFTPQYQSLEQLWRFFKGEVVVLGFPCNQFGNQEPGDENEILDFCTTRYQVSFPLFSKVEVNGPNAHELFQFLTNEKPGIFGTQAIKWNFTKFLIDPSGQVVKRYAPTTSPEEIKKELIQILQRPVDHADNSP